MFGCLAGLGIAACLLFTLRARQRYRRLRSSEGGGPLHRLAPSESLPLNGEENPRDDLAFDGLDLSGPLPSHFLGQGRQGGRGLSGSGAAVDSSGRGTSSSIPSYCSGADSGRERSGGGGVRRATGTAGSEGPPGPLGAQQWAPGGSSPHARTHSTHSSLFAFLCGIPKHAMLAGEHGSGGPAGGGGMFVGEADGGAGASGRQHAITVHGSPMGSEEGHEGRGTGGPLRGSGGGAGKGVGASSSQGFLRRAISALFTVCVGGEGMVTGNMHRAGGRAGSAAGGRGTGSQRVWDVEGGASAGGALAAGAGGILAGAAGGRLGRVRGALSPSGEEQAGELGQEDASQSSQMNGGGRGWPFAHKLSEVSAVGMSFNFPWLYMIVREGLGHVANHMWSGSHDHHARPS